MQTTEEVPLSVTAERAVVTQQAGKAPEKDWVIVTRGLKREYDMGGEIVRALRGVDVAIRRNEYVAIMGPSGSGKSTLMNLIGCLDTPDAGEYWLSGELVSSMADDELARVRNREIGFVFQTFNLLPRATALHNVELPLVYAGVPSDERASAPSRRSSACSSATAYQHRPNELSGGQRQRVAIARALVNEPSILLADEPTGNLDSTTSEEIMRVFEGLAEQGQTVIMVTHEARHRRACKASHRSARRHDRERRPPREIRRKDADRGSIHPAQVNHALLRRGPAGARPDPRAEAEELLHAPRRYHRRHVPHRRHLDRAGHEQLHGERLRRQARRRQHGDASKGAGDRRRHQRCTVARDAEMAACSDDRCAARRRRIAGGHALERRRLRQRLCVIAMGYAESSSRPALSKATTSRFAR